MVDSMKISGEIARLAPGCDSSHIVRPIEIGRDTWRNELLLFVKPEVFMIDETEQIVRSLSLVFRKLKEFDAQPHGIMIVGGRVLAEKGIMSRHYGYINELSRSASQILDDNDREEIAEIFDLPVDEYKILGGHEYLNYFMDEDSSDLDQLWFKGKSTKIRSGFYVRAIRKDGRSIVLVNGFHPAQLEHYTDPSRRIALVLLHSDTDWTVLRDHMVGTTFPEEASSDSIRGTLYARPRYYGFETVSIANNAVHLSAGPFEAAFEIMNFFGNIFRFDPSQNPPMILRRMLDRDIDVQRALGTLNNPIAPNSITPTDLFTATEDMNTDTAIAFWEQEFLTRES